MRTKPKNQQRAADPEAVRATVYMSPELHESMTLATAEERKRQRAARAVRDQIKGKREYSRVTLSATIIKACEEFIMIHFPKFRAKPKRKAA